VRTDGPVVIALDGSQQSAATLAWGMAEAVRRRADVILTRATGDPWLTAAWSWYPVDMANADVDAKEYLTDQHLREGARHPGIDIQTRLLHGSVVSELRDLSDDAQLVVVGAGMPTGRGRSGVVGAHLAAHAKSPVAVVRSDPDNPPLPEAPILVGVDGSPASIVAAHVAAREAWMRGRTLVIVHAQPAYTDAFELVDAAPEPAADDRTHRAALHVMRCLVAEHPGLEVRLELVEGDPADELVAMSHAAALIVVGTRGLGSFRGMLLGSVSSDVLRAATCPVLVVHDEDRPDAS
jgi:nucleotide-binding universal stress UspA family protein